MVTTPKTKDGIYGMLGTSGRSVVIGHVNLMSIITFLQTKHALMEDVRFRPAHKILQLRGCHC